MLNTNEIEKVAEKQILKSETTTTAANAANAILDDSNLDAELAEELLLDEADLMASEALEAADAVPESVEPVIDIAVDAYSDFDVDSIDNILELKADQFPRFTLAKNKARFLRMVSDYRSKQEWLDVAPLSGVTKLFKQQTKELVGIRAKKLDYEMEIEMGTLTPVQISHRRDELKMCKVQEKMAVSLISKMQVKIRSGRR